MIFILIFLFCYSPSLASMKKDDFAVCTLLSQLNNAQQSIPNKILHQLTTKDIVNLSYLNKNHEYEYLLRYAAEKEDVELFRSIKNNVSFTLLHDFLAWAHCPNSNWPPDIYELIDAYKGEMRNEDARKKILLYIKTYNDQSDKTVLSRIARLKRIFASNGKYESPLSIAITHNNLLFALRLVDINKQQLFYSNSTGFTLLFLALQGKSKILNILYRYYSTRNKEIWLYCLEVMNYRSIDENLCFLINNAIPAKDICVGDTDYLLWLATSFHLIHSIDALLPLVDINKVNALGDTLIHTAIKKKNHYLISVLLHSCDSLINIQNRQGLTYKEMCKNNPCLLVHPSFYDNTHKRFNPSLFEQFHIAFTLRHSLAQEESNALATIIKYLTINIYPITTGIVTKKYLYACINISKDFEIEYVIEYIKKQSTFMMQNLFNDQHDYLKKGLWRVEYFFSQDPFFKYNKVQRYLRIAKTN